MGVRTDWVRRAIAKITGSNGDRQGFGFGATDATGATEDK